MTSILKLTVEQLKDCPHFKLINMQDKILDHYAQAISDLNELDQFQKVIWQIMDLLGQAGEVYTVHQFKEQLSSMLQQIECFIDDSSVHIDEIVQANTHAYHKAIQDEQNLSILNKWLSSEHEKLNTFIHNQDTLAQFPSSTTDLIKISQLLKEHVRHVIVHLDALKTKKNDFAVIAGKTQELNVLMDSMHRWITVQYEFKGLTPPKAPEKFQLLASEETDSPSKQPIKSKPSFFSEPQPQKTLTDNNCLPHFSYKEPMCPARNYQPLAINSCPEGPMGSECSIQQPSLSNSQYIGLLALVPIGLLAIYLLYQSKNKSDPQVDILGSKEDYEQIKTEVDDLIVEIQREKDADNEETEYAYEDFMETYKQIEAQKEGYNVGALQELLKDLHYFHDEYFQKTQVTHNY